MAKICLYLCREAFHLLKVLDCGSIPHSLNITMNILIHLLLSHVALPFSTARRSVAMIQAHPMIIGMTHRKKAG